MKKVYVKILAAGLSVLLLPFIITMVLSGRPSGSNTIGSMDFNIICEKNGSRITLDFNQYLIGVVAANMPAGYELEALKAQAVIIRTYALYNISLLKEEMPEQTDFTTSELGLSYIGIDDMEQFWTSDEYLIYFTKLENSVYGTEGEVLTYDKQLILPVYFDTGSGYTRNAIEAWGVDIPYLISVQSRQDIMSIHFLKILEYGVPDLIDKLGALYSGIDITADTFFDDVKVQKRDSTGYVIEMGLGSLTVSGEKFAKALGLNSNNFIIEEYDGKARFICTGSGHGLGLSQYGANAMAVEGYTYKDILKHYYTDVQIINLTPK